MMINGGKTNKNEKGEATESRKSLFDKFEKEKSFAGQRLDFSGGFTLGCSLKFL